MQSSDWNINESSLKDCSINQTVIYKIEKHQVLLDADDYKDLIKRLFRLESQIFNLKFFVSNCHREIQNSETPEVFIKRAFSSNYVVEMLNET